MATFTDDRVVGGGYGAGDGGIGLLAALALMNRRGVDDGVGSSCIGPQIVAAADGINHNINTSTIGLNHNINTALTGLTNQINTGFGGQRDLDLMQKLGNIEGDIWKAEGQVQLAVQVAQTALTDRIADSTLNVVQGQGIINKNIFDASMTNLTGQSNILAAVKDSQYVTAVAIRDDGDKTRAQLALYHEGDLQRQLGVAQAALTEERHSGRIRDVEVSVNQSVNQNTAQSQAQTQAQQQFQILANLAAAVSNLAGDIQAVRQGQVIFNSGAMTGSATQAAANTKVA